MEIVTWHRDSHGLFDFESATVQKSSINNVIAGN